MSLNSVASANRTHIGFFGLRNAGKSSVVNAITNQEMSLVSEFKGTTTDPVSKAMEILPLGPVVIIDTPGMDDEGKLGELRIKRTLETLKKVDIAVLIVDGSIGLQAVDYELIDLFKEKELPYFIVYNKSDLLETIPEEKSNEIYVSAKDSYKINELKEKIAHVIKPGKERYLVRDLLQEDDIVVLVIPIDSSAPKGRLILPQQQAIRDVLDAHASCVVSQVDQLDSAIRSLKKKPRMVITDSQAFKEVSKIVPDDIYLTSFSILMARFKGSLETVVSGANTLDSLKDGDTILISEGCTHHRQCEDIGTVKIPNWIQTYTNKKLNFEFTSGHGFKEDVSKYALIIHCGACMLNEKEVQSRMIDAKNQSIPFTNYGISIAKMNGILDRSIAIFDGKFE